MPLGELKLFQFCFRNLSQVNSRLTTLRVCLNLKDRTLELENLTLFEIILQLLLFETKLTNFHVKVGLYSTYSFVASYFFLMKKTSAVTFMITPNISFFQSGFTYSICCVVINLGIFIEHLVLSVQIQLRGFTLKNIAKLIQLPNLYNFGRLLNSNFTTAIFARFVSYLN